MAANVENSFLTLYPYIKRYTEWPVSQAYFSHNYLLSALRNAVWTFIPDGCVVGMILLLFMVRYDAPKKLQIFYGCIVMQVLLIAMIWASFLQPNSTRWSLWRLLTENRVMTAIGYASYTIYLLQNVLLNFYGRILYDDIRLGYFPVIPGGYSPDYGVYWNTWWIGDEAWYYKPIGFSLLILVCWPIQKYFQDTFVASLAAKMMAWGNKWGRGMPRSLNELHSKYSQVFTNFRYTTLRRYWARALLVCMTVILFLFYFSILITNSRSFKKNESLSVLQVVDGQAAGHAAAGNMTSSQINPLMAMGQANPI